MIPEPFEIYEVDLVYGEATYPRPCVITSRPDKGLVTVMLISSAMELYEGPRVHFRIYEDDPDFVRTGLKKESYAASDRESDVPLSKLLRKRGKLNGELLKRFMDWHG